MKESFFMNNRRNIILLIAICLILIAMSIAMLFYAIRTDKVMKHELNQSIAITKEGHLEVLSDIGLIQTIDPLVINLTRLNNEEDNNDLKVQINFELEGNNSINEFEEKKIIIRDRLITLLSSKTFKELATEDGKEKLKIDIINIVQPIVKKTKIKHVFFTTFIMK